LFSASHVAAKLATMLTLDFVHFVNGVLQIPSGRHCLVMKLIGKGDAGEENSTQEYRKRCDFHEM